MNIKTLILTVITASSLSACMAYNSFSEVKALKKADAVGSSFTQTLTKEYRSFSNDELKSERDYEEALHFARKGLESADGYITMPEPVTDWNLNEAQNDVLETARQRMIVMFDYGAREVYPEQAAIAQASFDCWVENEEEVNVKSKSTEDAAFCEKRYKDALAMLEANLRKPEPVIEEPAFPAPVEAVADDGSMIATEEAIYLIFFDFDSAKIGANGMDIITTMAEEIKGRNLNEVMVVGHADTSGAKDYNQRLGLRRAKAIKKALVNMGISGTLITTESRGESELLVQTSDGTKEPANRRGTVTFE